MLIDAVSEPEKKLIRPLPKKKRMVLPPPEEVMRKSMSHGNLLKNRLKAKQLIKNGSASGEKEKMVATSRIMDRSRQSIDQFFHLKPLESQFHREDDE